ncbi:ABC transporter ATP-binding protein [Corynebacterium hansenii]|uniref:ABC transporter ATP-binding protein n=1 Tax=Corynebacterium hansenii TaxID=394964 RepID=A0ABV7ZLG7_9CORY|nr:ABC transporter ATP-binding protein [Corynebacterium hansenii]WJY99601.1 putative siderophore transport system ATP-binding protein YusV [Corynebacterium hansenii]
MIASLDVESVAVDVGKRRLLTDVTFAAAPGSLTAVVGVNGVGKSTLMRALAGIVAPAEGRVLYDGRDLARMRPRERARLVGFVGQDERPPGELTAAEFVALGRLPHTSPWDLGGQAGHAAVRSALELMGVAEHADSMCDRLSGGQVRRVVLARGLAQETGLLLLDEPTNHLDVHHRIHLLRVLRESGRTVVANIHDLDLAMSHFDRVVLLHDGTVLRRGEPEHVLAPDAVRAAFDVESQVVRPEGSPRPHLIIEST